MADAPSVPDGSTNRPEQAEIERSLIDFIGQELVDSASRAADPVGRDDDLLTSGLVSSLAVMRLIRFLEERYGVTIPAAAVTIENFLTVATIARYVGSLGPAEPAGAVGQG